MRVGVDTKGYVDMCRGVPDAVEVVEAAERVFLPFVVLGELRAGFRAGSYEAENEAALRRFLTKPGVEILFADSQTTYHYAAVFLQLRRQGTPIPTNDMWTAALVVQHDLSLLARDRHFEHLPQVQLV